MDLLTQLPSSYNKEYVIIWKMTNIIICVILHLPQNIV